MKQIDKSVVKAGIDKAMVEFTSRVEVFGFVRTKKWIWVRVAENHADFIHIHLDGISYGAPISYSVSFRVHCGFRTFDDESEALALNGPCSTEPVYRDKKYHHRFNAKSGSTYERCLDDLLRFIGDVGEPWFKGHSSVNAGTIQSAELIKKSLKLLGVKQTTT